MNKLSLFNISVFGTVKFRLFFMFFRHFDKNSQKIVFFATFEYHIAPKPLLIVTSGSNLTLKKAKMKKIPCTVP